MAGRKKDVVPVVVPDDFIAKDAARVLLLSAGVAAHIAEADASFRAGFDQAGLFDPTDTVTGWTPDGKINLGKVQMQGGGEAAKVVDDLALLDWAMTHFRSAVATKPGEPTPDQGIRAARVLQTESTQAYGETRGKAIAEAMLIEAGTTRHVHEANVTAWLRAAETGEVVKDDTGAEWVQVPGIEVQETPRKFVVTTNKATIGGVIADLLGGSGLVAIEAAPKAGS